MTSSQGPGLVGPDMGGPHPSIYGSFRRNPEELPQTRSQSPDSAPTTLARNSNSNSSSNNAPRQPLAMPFVPSGPQQYAQSNASIYAGPGHSSGPATPAQAGPVHYPPVSRPPPQSQPSQSRPPMAPQQQQQQQYQGPLPPTQAQQQQQQQQQYQGPLPPTQAQQQQQQQQQQQPYGPFAGAVGDTSSSIFSSPRPHGEGAAHTAPGAYYAPTSNSSNSNAGGPSAFGRPQHPPGSNYPGSVYTATSHPPSHPASHGPQFQPGGRPAPSAAGQSSAYHGPQSFYSYANSAAEDRAANRMGTAGKVALGALAAGAVAYGMHGLVENSSDDEKRKEVLRRQRAEEERARRENNARRRREEEETRRREDYERWRRDENERYQQTIRAQQQKQQQQQQQEQPYHQSQQQQQPPPPPPSLQQHHSFAGVASVASMAGGPPARYRSESLSSSTHLSFVSDSFQPPAPFGRPPYTFDPRDTRAPNPSRSSQNSRTAETYPQLRQNPADTKIKIGTILALKHIASGRHLRTDRSHSTDSGSNQQLVYAHRRSVDEDDWWQVLPANTDTPAPGSIVTYGMQVRLRHVETGRHLQSQYGFVEPSTGQNEATASGDQAHSDENHHWVIERWGDGAYGKTWKSTDTVVLRHYVSGMVLHSHDLPAPGDVHPVTCAGAGGSENDQWRAVLSQ